MCYIISKIIGRVKMLHDTGVSPHYRGNSLNEHTIHSLSPPGTSHQSPGSQLPQSPVTLLDYFLSLFFPHCELSHFSPSTYRQLVPLVSATPLTVLYCSFNVWHTNHIYYLLLIPVSSRQKLSMIRGCLLHGRNKEMIFVQIVIS